MSNGQRRRIPGLGAVIAVAFLLVPLAVVAWWLNRPKGEPTAPGPALADLDVVCLGRVDGLAPVAALEPAMPGKVAELFVVEGKHVEAKEKLLRLDDESLKLRVEEAQAAVAAAELETEIARQDQKFLPARKKTQEALKAAAVDRAVAARKLYEEKVKSAMFNTVTTAELIASEAEVKQLEQLAEAEKARLQELEATDPSLRVRTAEIKKTSAQIACGKPRRPCATACCSPPPPERCCACKRRLGKRWHPRAFSRRSSSARMGRWWCGLNWSKNSSAASNRA